MSDYRKFREGRVPLLVRCACVELLVTTVLSFGCDRAASPKKSVVPATSPAPAEWFQDITDRSGLNFVHSVGTTPTYFMPHVMGSGGALIDYDNDGRLDVYLVQNAGPDSKVTNRLFHQEADGTFTDRSAGSGLDVAGYGMGVAVGDINNDGLPDLCLTEYGRTRLFANRGGGKFEDISESAGIDNTDWGTSACFFDYDRDGWLDLVIVNYVQYSEANRCADEANRHDFCGPQSFIGSLPKLFHNVSGKSRDRLQPILFEDVTHPAGLATTGSRGLGVACIDFTGDGWPDILIANDAQPNRLWVNRGDGTFAEEAMQRGLAVNALGQPAANMGIVIGDVRGTGGLDVAITHLTEEGTTTWSERASGTFQDSTNSLMLNQLARGTGFGISLTDFDNDGFPDLAVANGRVTRSKDSMGGAGPFWAPYAEQNHLFANRSGSRFEDVNAANPSFCKAASVSRVVLAGDLDNDGGVDLIVTRIGDSAKVYRNACTIRGHWLTIKAVDPAVGGRDAYGARVIVKTADRKFVGWIQPGLGYLGNNDARAHFGLGTHAQVDGIEVVWPDGSREHFAGGAADRFRVVEKGSGEKAADR